MAAIDFLHHENTPTWAGIEPATLGAEGQRQTYHATQRAHNGLISNVTSDSGHQLLWRERGTRYAQKSVCGRDRYGPGYELKNNGLPPDNPEAYRFAVDYRKLNTITKHPRYPLPLIEYLITNIPHTTIMSSLDLHSGYFQLAINRSDVVKIAFVTKNGTYAFIRMPFGLFGADPNFWKAIDIILKPVIERFGNVYMDDVIISLPQIAHHVKHLREVFRLLQEAVLTLNKDKCNFHCDKFKYLGLVINKEGITTDEAKVKAIAEMRPPKNSKEVSTF
ncbi:retrovirus-related Pol polyprotein from transposon opus [Trichonephila clavipes]|nr:retrovirus-related Pol polyprotein from transposon opus [Trichonephila clavipes]